MKDIKSTKDMVDFVSRKLHLETIKDDSSLALQNDLVRTEILQLGRHLAYDDTLVTLKKPGTQIVWHVAMPKSGSTWVSMVLKNGLAAKNWRTTSLVPAYGRREQQVVPIELLRQNSLDANVFVPHQHCMHSQYAFDFIKKFDVKLILQIRSIPDCIVSLIDHFNKDVGEGPLAFLDNGLWSSYDTNQKLRFVVDLILPWYINFWVGWSQGIQRQKLTHKLVQYENVLNNTLTEFSDIAAFCDNRIINSDVSVWLENAQKRNTRKNTAISGRGSELPDWVHEHMQRLINYYPEVDFSEVGIVKI
jgi:hypothetical protein